MNNAVRYQVMPPLAPDEYQELYEDIEQRAKMPGWSKLSDEEIAWFFTQHEDPQVAKAAVMNAMWRDGHPGWREKKRTGSVYFIEAPSVGLVKIGYSDNAQSRFKNIQGMSPVPLVMIGTMPGCLSDERELHKRFADCRSHGEWFFITDEIKNFIEENA